MGEKDNGFPVKEDCKLQTNQYTSIRTRRNMFTSIIGNIDANAGDTAAKEVIRRFMCIMENTY